MDSDDLRLSANPILCRIFMAKRTKIVPIDQRKDQLVAEDEKTHRVIFHIGGQRFAIDLLSRVRALPPATGDRPADVLPIRKK